MPFKLSFSWYLSTISSFLSPIWLYSSLVTSNAVTVVVGGLSFFFPTLSDIYVSIGTHRSQDLNVARQWWCTPLISALRRQRQFQDNQETVSKTKKKKKKKKKQNLVGIITLHHFKVRKGSGDGKCLCLQLSVHWADQSQLQGLFSSTSHLIIAETTDVHQQLLHDF